jgi:hypothetical protein
MITDTMRRGSSSGRRFAGTVPTSGPPHPQQSGEDVEEEGMISGQDIRLLPKCSDGAYLRIDARTLR